MPWRSPSLLPSQMSPDGLNLSVLPGRMQPCRNGCDGLGAVDAGGPVRTGLSREIDERIHRAIAAITPVSFGTVQDPNLAVSLRTLVHVPTKFCSQDPANGRTSDREKVS